MSRAVLVATIGQKLSVNSRKRSRRCRAGPRCVCMSIRPGRIVRLPKVDMLHIGAPASPSARRRSSVMWPVSSTKIAGFCNVAAGLDVEIALGGHDGRAVQRRWTKAMQRQSAVDGSLRPPQRIFRKTFVVRSAGVRHCLFFGGQIERMVVGRAEAGAVRDGVVPVRAPDAVRVAKARRPGLASPVERDVERFA